MASQKTNSREVGFTSCRGRSQKLRAFTEKELETVRAAKKLLSVPTFGRGSARAGVKYAPMLLGKYENSKKTRRFHALFGL
jgi:hypothetical protein